MRAISRLILTIIPGLVLALLCVFILNAQRVSAQYLPSHDEPSFNGPQAVTAQPYQSPAYVPNQFIATGAAVELSRLQTYLKDRFQGRVTLDRRIDLRFMANVSGTLFFDPKQLPTLFSFVFTILDPSISLEQLITDLNNIQAFDTMLIEYDLIIANPWSIGGSPWSIGGSPVTTPTIGADPDEYRQQFKYLTEYGLAPLAASATPYSYTGQGTSIAIFDTSPFSQSMLTPKLQHFDGIPISVTHILADPLPDPSPVYIPGHGLFAAGLAHAIAPSATLVLYRVLDDTGRGRESDLLTALSQFSSTLVATPTVINLSFGVSPAVPLFALETLSNVLHGLHYLNNTIVAAAGNNSSLTTTQPMLYPAAFDWVIGVAASNVDGHRSCYSNIAWDPTNAKKGVGAPGGQGDTTGGDCIPPSGPDQIACPGDPLCLMTSWWNPSSAPNYTLGAGTSFAAPIVSGVAALTRQMKGAGASSNVLNQYIYDHVRPRENELGYGIINLTDMFLPQKVYMPTQAKE